MTPDPLPPPDPRLRQALRHAPDADAGPPAALSARILADARRAVVPPPWWRALTRPAGAAAFASIVLAGFIGLMWRGGLPPEPSEQELSRPARQQPSAAARVASQAAAPAAAPPVAALRQDEAAERPAMADRAQASGDPPLVEPARREAEPVGRTEERGAGDAAKARMRSQPTAPGDPAARPGRAGPAGAAAAPAFADAAGPAERAAAPAAAPAAEARPLADPLAPLLARLRADGALPAAWTELQALARDRWLPEGADAAAPSGHRIEAADGTLLGWLQWDETGVTLQGPQGGLRWRAPLPPADAARLRAALTR